MCNFLFEIARISSCIFAFSQHGFFESAAAQIKAEFHIKKKKKLYCYCWMKSTAVAFI